MIRVRQVKVKVEEDNQKNLLNRINKKLNLKNNKILEIKMKYIIYMK